MAAFFGTVTTTNNKDFKFFTWWVCDSIILYWSWCFFLLGANSET